MSKWHTTPEAHKTANNTWQDALTLAVQSLAPGPHERGVLELGFAEYYDGTKEAKVPIHITLDRPVDVVGRGGGFRCSASRIHGSIENQASGSRIRDLGLHNAAGDAIKITRRCDIENVHIAYQGGCGVVMAGTSGANNVNSSTARNVFVDDPQVGGSGFYAFGGDSGHILWDHCGVYGLKGGDRIGPIFDAQAEAEAYAQNVVPPLYVVALDHVSQPCHAWGCFERPVATGFKKEGPNTITLLAPFCEWGASPNTRGFHIAPDGGGCETINAHDESGGLWAEVGGVVTAGNWQRGLRPAPGPRPLLLTGANTVGPFTVPLFTNAGAWVGAVQFGAGGTPLAFVDAQGRTLAFWFENDHLVVGDSEGQNPGGPPLPGPWATVMKFPLERGSDSRPRFPLGIVAPGVTSP